MKEGIIRMGGGEMREMRKSEERRERTPCFHEYFRVFFFL